MWPTQNLDRAREMKKAIRVHKAREVRKREGGEDRDGPGNDH